MYTRVALIQCVDVRFIASVVSQYSSILHNILLVHVVFLGKINDQFFENSTTMYNTFDCQPIITNDTGMLLYHDT